MTEVELTEVLAAIARIRADADQVSRTLQTSMSADPQSSAALHRLGVVLRDAVTAIDQLRTAH
jgi:hypothetical protein